MNDTRIKNAPYYLHDEHLDRATIEYLKVLNGSPRPVETLPVADARKVLINAQAAEKVDISGIEEREEIIDSDGFEVKLDIVRPAGVHGKTAAFMFLHGGGWVLGDYPTHRRLVRDLVVGSGATAVFVNYTPSPEAVYPQALNEIFASLKWVAGNGRKLDIDGDRIAIAGNSVGGNMSIATALRAKSCGGPALRCQVLLWPVTTASTDWESYRLYGSQRFLTAPLMKWMFDLYHPDPDVRREPYFSPLNAPEAQLHGLPPTLIAVAENDILRDQGEALGRKLDRAGVETTCVRFNGVIHDWGMLNGYAATAPTRAVVDLAAATLRRYLQ